jgi:HAMP domain-containing protein
MKLLLKFNLIFVLVFAAGLAVTAYIARDLLRANAEAEVAGNARLLMESAVAARTFTSNQIAPLLQTQMKYTFLPQSVPAYVATEVLGELRKKYPEYSYKEATLNPTNPRDRAVEWEADLVNQFRNNSTVTEYIGQRDTPVGRTFYIARAMKITNPNCLVCHSVPDAAPAPMVQKYGTANGFGWNLNEVIGAQVVSVPMEVPFKRAEQTFGVFMSLIVGVFLTIGVVLNLMLWALVIRPVTRLSGLADRVSMGEMEAPEFETKARDEIGTLAESFGRMRKSLVQAMKMLES